MKDALTVCYVKWLDACRRPGNFTTEDIRKNDLDRVILQTAGIFVQQTRDTLTIAESFDPSEGTYRDLIHIPTGMIENVRKFSLDAPKPTRRKPKSRTSKK